jgi:hypothetical protein
MKHNYQETCSKCGTDLKEIREFHSKVKPEVLLKIVKSGQKACISCIELVLGRRLTKNDYTNDKVNKINYGSKSAKLLNRLNKDK